MKRILTLALLLVVSDLVAQGGWTSTQITTVTRYDDIFFINDQIGWAAGGGSARVYKTTDGGETWSELPTVFPGYLRSIKFFDENIGLLGSVTGNLFRTTDGGETWVDVAPDINPKPEGVCGLAIADANAIYGVGIWNDPAFVIKSVDKGLTWTYTSMSAHAYSLIDAYFFDKDHGFVTGNVTGKGGGIVLYTDDGGATWTEKFRTNHESDRIWKIQSPDGQTFFGSIEALIENDGVPTRFIKSEDKGQTWEMGIVSNTTYNIQAIGFIDRWHGWTGGRNALFETENGGRTWKQISLGATYNRFFKINNEKAFLTGRKVYKYTRDVVTGTPDPETHDPIHYISIASNPTAGKTNVHVKFGKPTMAQVYIYSMTGKKLKMIFDGEVAAGEKIFPVDVTDQPAQSLVVVMQTNEGIESATMVKQ